MTAKIVLDGDRALLEKRDGTTEIRAIKRTLTSEEVAELMAELGDDNAPRTEQGD